MSDLFAELKRLAELDPTRCRPRASTGYGLQINSLEHDVYPTTSKRITDNSHAIVLLSLLEAINTAEAELRIKIENDGRQWHVVLYPTDLQCHFNGSNAEPVLAVLEAYLEWLEFDRTGDEQIGGEG